MLLTPRSTPRKPSISDGSGPSNIAGLEQVKLPITADKIDLSLPCFKQPELASARNKRKFNTTAKRPQRDDSFVYLPGEDAVIISNGPCGLNVLCFAIQFVRICNLRYEPNSNLGTRSRSSPNR